MATKFVRKSLQLAAVGLVAVSGLALAQEPASGGGSSQNSGWRRLGDPTRQGTYSSTQSDPGASAYPDPNYSQSRTQQPQQQQPSQQAPPPPQYPPAQQQQSQQYSAVPARISVPAGTYVTVRVNQQLSSDRNQPGDPFSATLARPVVAGGVVLAEPGQTLGGRVAQAQKAGHVEGLAKLGVELTDLSLVDGQQMPVRTSLISRTGNSSVGRDAGTIATTTGVGAAIGAAAGWGRGAAIGAGAGAAAGIIGVLVTHGQPSVIYPEQLLTFRLEDTLTISTERSPQAFRYVHANEYNQPNYDQGAAYGQTGPAYGATPAPAPYYSYPNYYAYSGYPYYYPYYSSGFSLYVGPGWGRGYYGGGRFYGGRGYYGGRRR